MTPTEPAEIGLGEANPRHVQHRTAGALLALPDRAPHLRGEAHSGNRPVDRSRHSGVQEGNARRGDRAPDHRQAHPAARRHGRAEAVTASDSYDVVIVGGGPAGLSAALVLGRAPRRVVLFDHGRYRNAASRRMHGYLSPDRIRPPAFLTISRRELRTYDAQIHPEVVPHVR